MNKTFSVRIEKIAHDGAGEAIVEGIPLRVHGMLPGEEGVVEAMKKRGIFVGTLKELITSSPSRKTPEELHYLSCSPWQVMEYPLQMELKRNILVELFGYYDDAPKVLFTAAEQFYGYRTKVEFSFCDREGEATIPLSLAFHERGGGSRRLKLEKGCMLASEAMNRVALALTAKLRDLGYTARDLKTLVVRESKSEGKILAILFAKAKEIKEFPVDDIEGLSGFIVFHSTEKSPASVPTQKLWSVGEESLTERVGGNHISYSWDSFFQNNIPVFVIALEKMKEAIPEGAKVLELYAGAGTIGLALAQVSSSVMAIEIVPAAVEAANRNAQVNNINNFTAECLPAEKIDASILEGKDVLVLDPPRAGLHPKLIDHIIEKQPPTIVYLSCNPETQARDYSLLKDTYQIIHIEGFDFYPNTPHLESLLILKLR